MLVLIEMKNISFLFFLISLASLTLFSCHPRDPKVLQDHEIRGASNSGRGFSNNRSSDKSSTTFQVDWADRFDQVSTFMVTAELDRITQLPNFIDEIVDQYKNLTHDACLTQIQWAESATETIVTGRLQLANCYLGIGRGLFADGQIEFVKKIGFDKQVHYQFRTLADENLILKIKVGKDLQKVDVSYSFILLKNEFASYIQQARINYKVSDRFQNNQNLAIVLNGQFSNQETRLTAVSDYRAISSEGEKVAFFDSKLTINSKNQALELASIQSFDWCQLRDQQYAYDFNYKAPQRRVGAQLTRKGYDFQITSSSAKDSTREFNSRDYCQSNKRNIGTHALLLNPYVQGLFVK